MSEFVQTYNAVLLNEGGYNRAYAASGETYKGIDRMYSPTWPGWKIIDAYKAQYGIPGEEAIINNAELNGYVAAWYQQFLGRLLNIEAIVNQTLANFTADFLIHKQYDAIRVINAVAVTVQAAIRSNVQVQAEAEKINDSVLFTMNANPQLFYLYLMDARRKYYINPAQFGSTLKFSPALVASFINRVNSFPAQA